MGRHRRAATRRARACSARSPTSPTTARSSRSSRASKAWCTSPRWTGPTRTSHPTKVVQLGDEVEVMILEIDEDTPPHLARHEAVHAEPVGRVRRRTTRRATRCKGQIKSITDFGVFVGLPGGIDGLVHLSDLSWTSRARRPCANYKKGRGSRGGGAGHRRRARAHLARHQAARRRSVHQLRRQRTTRAASSSGKVKSVDAKGAVIDARRRRRRLPARLRDRARPRRGHRART